MTTKSKAEIMEEMRKRRTDAGLIRLEYWATKKQHKKLKAKLKELNT